MEDKHQRQIVLDDALLIGMVQEKGEMVETGRSMSRQMEEIAKQHEALGKKLAAHAEKLNNKKLDIFKRVEKLAKGLLGDFEIPVTTQLKNGKLVLIVTEAL